MKGDDDMHINDGNDMTSSDRGDPVDDAVLMDRLAAYGDVLREELTAGESAHSGLNATPRTHHRDQPPPAEIIALRPASSASRRLPVWTRAAAVVALLVVAGVVFAAIAPESERVALEVPSTQTPVAAHTTDEVEGADELEDLSEDDAHPEDDFKTDAVEEITTDASAISVAETEALEEEPAINPNLVPVFEVPAMPGVFICPPGSTGTPVAGGFCTRVSSLNASAEADSAAAIEPVKPTPTADPTGQTAPVIVTQRPDIVSCPKGSTGTPVAGGTCTWVQTRPVTVTEVIVFSCPPDSTETEENVCIADSTETESVAIVATTTREYTCPEGTTGAPVRGGTCRLARTETEIVPPILVSQPDGFEEISCPGVHAFDQNGDCAAEVDVTTEVDVIVTETISYSCPDGYAGTEVATGTCLRPIPGDVVDLLISPAVLNYSCPLGFSGEAVEGGSCEREEQVPVVSTPQEPHVSCPPGYSGVLIAEGVCTRS